MTTFASWWFYCELLQDCLGSFSEALYRASPELEHLFQVGFDEMERLVRPEFFIEGPDYPPEEVSAALCGGLWPVFAGLGCSDAVS